MITPGLHNTPPPGIDWDLKRWPHFTALELSCRCAGKFCHGEYWHDEAFLDALERLRVATGKPLIINSGHRCEKWNEHEGGVIRNGDGSGGSQHLRIAVDVSLHGHDRHLLGANAKAAGFTGFGLGASFLHLDRRKTATTWNYGAASLKAWGIT